MLFKRLIRQGLTFHNGFIYEGTGMNGASQIRRLDPSNPSIVLQSHSLPAQYFGEGITFYVDRDGNNRFIQLTWKEKIAFIYDADSLDLIKQFEYDTTTGEGWGITFLSETCEFIISDGSQYLIFWDCQSFKEKRRVEVKYTKDHETTSISLLNELEVRKMDDKNVAILANVWFQDVLLQIEPSNGHVDRVYYFNSLYTQRQGREDVFNGISTSGHDNNIFYLTGKLWPFLYKVKFNK